MTRHPKVANYAALIAAERRAEYETLIVSDKIREKYRIDDNGDATGQPTQGDINRESAAWANVYGLRMRRYALVGVDPVRDIRAPLPLPEDPQERAK